MEDHNQKSTPIDDPRVIQFISSVTMTFGVKVAVVIIGVATGIIVARALGPAGRGAYALFAAFPGLVLAFVHLGIAQANVYYLRKSEVKVDPAIIRINTLVLSIAISAATLLALWFLRPWLFSSVLKDLEPKYYTILLILMPFFILETYTSSFLVAYERFRLINSVSFLLRILDTIAIVFVLLIFRMGLWGACLTLLGFHISDSLIKCYFVFWNKPIETKPALGVIKRSLAYGLKSHLQSLTGLLHYKIDIFMLAALLSTTDVGYYSIAVSLVSLTFLIPESVGLVLFPRLAGLADKDASEFTAQVCRNTIFVAALSALAIFILGRPAIQIMYGAEYLPACKAVNLLLPGIMAMCVYKILGRNFTSRNRQEVTIVAGLVGLAANIALNLVLIPKMGITGAAISTSVSYSLSSILLLLVFLNDSGRTFQNTVLLNQSDIAAWSGLLLGKLMRAKERR